MLDYIFFFSLALVAVASAVGMLLSRSAVYAALNLILNFMTIAVIYLMLGAPFIALAQVTVYAGAIMVLFLFVIMLLGSEKIDSPSALPWQRPLAIFLAAVLIIETGYLAFTRWGSLGALRQVEAGFGAPEKVGLALFSQYLLPFEIVSVLLLAAMVGAIVLTHKEKRTY